MTMNLTFLNSLDPTVFIFVFNICFFLGTDTVNIDTTEMTVIPCMYHNACANLQHLSLGGLL